MCEPCPADTYRSGDAMPDNNACLAIPAGYSASTFPATLGDGSANTAIKAASAIAPCDKGSVSFYSGAARVPTGKPDKCELCSAVGANTYAPRLGMANCLACEGGTAPNAAHDACTACDPNTYRNFATIA